MPVNVSSPKTVNAVVPDPLPVDVVSSVLPTGASTEAKQDTGNANLSSIDGKVATSAKQDSQIALETSIDGKFPAAAAAADGASNVATMSAIRSRLMVYNGTTWDMLRGSLAGVTAGVIATWTGMAQVLGLSRYLATRPTLADGQGSHLQSNTRGDLATQEQYLPDYEDNANDVAWTGNRALAVSTGAWTNYNSGSTKVGTTGISVKATAGRVRRIGCYNSGAGSVYLVLVNKATAAVNNDAVIAQIAVPSLGSVPLDFGPEGLYLATGISLAVSTAGEKVTLPVASDCNVWCQYL